MGVAPSSFSKAGGSGDNLQYWVSIKTRTNCKRTHAVRTKKFSFRATPAGTTVGSASDCDITLEDTYLSPVHATVSLDHAGNVVLTPNGRTYWLIGQGEKSAGPRPLVKEQVVKMGACSLLVTDTCCERSGEAKHHPTEGEDASEQVCYICFDDTNTDEQRLVPSPCACRKFVHKSCLSRWITTKGSRLCSICKSKLPIEFTVDPPYLVLQVVRHMRGLHWTGEREYIISFCNRTTNEVTVGSGNCGLHLPDPSLSKTHSRICYSDNQFYVQDLASTSGTFLKLLGPHVLELGAASEFKLGRTMITIKVKRKKRFLGWHRSKGVGAANSNSDSNGISSKAEQSTGLSPVVASQYDELHQSAAISADAAAAAAAAHAAAVAGHAGAGAGAGSGSAMGGPGPAMRRSDTGSATVPPPLAVRGHIHQDGSAATVATAGSHPAAPGAVNSPSFAGTAAAGAPSGGQSVTSSTGGVAGGRQPAVSAALPEDRMSPIGAIGAGAGAGAAALTLSEAVASADAEAAAEAAAAAERLPGASQTSVNDSVTAIALPHPVHVVDLPHEGSPSQFHDSA